MTPSQKGKKLHLVHLLFRLTLGKIKGISVLTPFLLLFEKKKKKRGYLELSLKGKLLFS